MHSLFIPLGDLRQDIARLRGADVPQDWPRPALSGDWSFVHILGLARSWEEDGKQIQHQERPQLAYALADLLTGLYLCGTSLAFLIVGEDYRAAVYWGLAAQQETEGHTDLTTLLRGSLPGVQLAPAQAAPLARQVLTLPNGAFMTGIPTPKVGDQLERLVRGLLGDGTWIYLVLAQPVPPGMITATFETLAEELRRVRNTYLRRTSVEEANHPLAQYYVELLEVGLDKYKLAQVQGAWETKTVLLSDNEALLRRGQALLTASFAGDRSLPQPIRFYRCLSTPLAHDASLPSTVLNTSDLSLLVRLPQEEAPGYRILPPYRFSVALPEAGQLHNNSRCLALGRILDRRAPTGEWLELAVRDLTKHMFITGVTGSGKTETCLFLLDQLWREAGIPFLVIEPVKREYRALRACPGYQGMKIFTLGDEREAPFRLNPFEVPKGIPVQMHVDLLRALFNAAFAGLYPPMPYFLEEALYGIYLDYGWDLISTATPTSSPKRFPSLTDLCLKVEEVVAQAGYDSEVTQNVATALRVRLNSLRIGAKGLMLDTPHSIPFEELLNTPVLLELASLGDPEVIALLMGLICIRLYEHRLAEMPEPSGSTSLKHLLLVEEAHRLLARLPPNAGIDTSQVQEKAVETFGNMLVELRAFGQGIAVVDQSPTKIHSDILKGTTLKITHRLVYKDDREAIAGCTNMSKRQMDALSTLATGQALIYTEGFLQPFLVQIPEFRAHTVRCEDRRSIKEQMRYFYECHPQLMASEG